MPLYPESQMWLTANFRKADFCFAALLAVATVAWMNLLLGCCGLSGSTAFLGTLTLDEGAPRQHGASVIIGAVQRRATR